MNPSEAPRMTRRHCPIDPATPDDGLHYFFGYYDKCPWSADGRSLLAHRVAFMDRFPTVADTCEIGLVTPADRKFLPLAATRAWNWQQGAQLQWLPGENGCWKIIYNDRRNGHPTAVLLNVDTAATTVFEHPVYTVSPDGKTALSLTYARLNLGRAEYGYPGLDTLETCRQAAPDDDGVWRVDLQTGERGLLVSIAEAAAYGAGPVSPDAFHYVNHMMFSPSGRRFCFMHRYERPDGIVHSRLFTLGTDGADLRLLMEGMVSHYHWRDEQTILAWAGRRTLLGAPSGKRGLKARGMTAARRMLKPVYYALGKPRLLMNKIVGDAYLLIRDAEPAPTEPFAKGRLVTDGHCTYNRGGTEPGRWVLTDGYPDLRSAQPLYLWDTRMEQGYEIGRYAAPAHLDGPVRVDLHPRFNHDATQVCIDSAMEGHRSMYRIDISSLTVDDRPPTAAITRTGGLGSVISGRDPAPEHATT